MRTAAGHAPPPITDREASVGDEQLRGDLLQGLEPGFRFRCTGCGNVTRFDVVEQARTRRYHHFDLGGQGRVEEEEFLERALETVTCRWCGRADAVEVEASPAPEA